MQQSTGQARVTQTDLGIPSGGLFGQARIYGNQPIGTISGPTGYNWYVRALPAVTSVGASTVAVTFDSNYVYWFDNVGGSYVPRYSFLNITLTENTGAQTLTFANNANGSTEVTVFNSLAAAVNPGMFVSYTDGRGVQTTIASQTGSQINELQRTYTVGGVTTIESLLYTYSGGGSSGSSGVGAGFLQSVLYRTQVNGGDWNPVKQVVYAYYGAYDANGSFDDLQSASQQLPDGQGGWNTVAVDYYRYWLPGSSTGFAHGLKTHFGPEAYRLLFNAGIDITLAADSVLQPYADHYFEYDPTTQKVTFASSAVCPSCPGGGVTSDIFTWSSNPHYPPNGFNTWITKCVQTLPDLSQIVTYTNFAGLPMLIVNIDPSGANMWGTFYRYAADGQVMWEAQPSAVALPTPLSMLEAYDDLLNYNSLTNQYSYLHSAQGLIKVTTYDAAGNVLTLAVKNGQNLSSGNLVQIAAFTYASNIDSNGNTITPVATSVRYPTAGSTTPSITTSYAYTFYIGTNQLQTRTTTLPVVSAGQNGSGVADTTVDDYDTYGNRTQYTDERGVVNQYTFDVVQSRITEQVLNVSTTTGPGYNVTTQYTYDNQGRRIQTIGQSHTAIAGCCACEIQTVNWTVYNQWPRPESGQWGLDETWTASGYVYNPTTIVDPITVTKTDKDGRTTDVIKTIAAAGTAPLVPSPNQGDWLTWSSTQYNSQHQKISSRTYHNIPASGIGTVGTSYGETDFGYDSLERLNRVVAPGGTITRTVWTTPQRVVSTSVGTNDAGANNMVMVTSNIYDNGTSSNPGGSGGDGNLVQQTQYVSATSGDTRVTNFSYDFRNRRISVTDAINRYTLNTFDNMDRLTQTQMYATNGGNLIAQNATNYDNRSRVYQRVNYAVDPGTGTVGNSLTGNSWYDPSGNAIQEIAIGAGQVFSKNQFNGVKWATASYTGYNTSGTSYAQASQTPSAAADTIIEQTLSTFDEAGNLVSTSIFQRLNDATGTGALSYGIQPEARVSYAASWFDGINRKIAGANYGAIASFTRPGTPPTSTETILVGSIAYDGAGRVYQSVDPKGVVAQTGFDDANRKSQTVEDVGGLDRTTNFTYTLDDLIATMEAINFSTGNQTTTYTFGTALATSGVARNDLAASTTYPDTGVVSSTYNRLGQPLTKTDQRGTVRTFFYDGLGRPTNDCVTTAGTGTDVTFKQIATGYEARGMLNLISSYDNATPGSGTVLNQVQLDYNAFAQLVKDWQSHSGSVVTSGSGISPSVQYGYDGGSGTTNEIRPLTLTYPNGRIITYSYGTPGGMNDYLNRTDTIQDTTSGTTNLASYTYLGARAVIQINYAVPQVMLDLWGGTSGVFTGFDEFGRIINQPWNNYNTSTMLDQYQYGYDLNSNRLWKANVVGTPVVTGGLDEFYTYDNLNRLTDMKRGALNSTQTGIIGTPTIEQQWTLDATGNWSEYGTLADGAATMTQGRVSNAVNEITSITSLAPPPPPTGTPTPAAWTTPAYDAAGNMTTIPQLATPTSTFTATYDAWNRMTELAAGSSIASYTYDGIYRRIVKYTSSTSETRHFYYTSAWQDIEERVGISASMDTQYLWGIRYIDELISRSDPTNGTLYATQDANFNVTGIIDSSGIPAQFQVYSPYGGVNFYSGAWMIGSDSYSWLFLPNGTILDSESGLNYARFRFSHPGLGLFLTRDLLVYLSGSNLSIYVRGNPIAFLDPWGLIPAFNWSQDQIDGNMLIIETTVITVVAFVIVFAIFSAPLTLAVGLGILVGLAIGVVLSAHAYDWPFPLSLLPPPPAPPGLAGPPNPPTTQPQPPADNSPTVGDWPYCVVQIIASTCAEPAGAVGMKWCIGCPSDQPQDESGCCPVGNSFQTRVLDIAPGKQPHRGDPTCIITVKYIANKCGDCPDELGVIIVPNIKD